MNASVLQDIRFPPGVNDLVHTFYISFLRVVHEDFKEGHCAMTIMSICPCIQCHINESLQKDKTLIKTKQHYERGQLTNYMFSVSLGCNVTNIPCWFHPVDLQWHWDYTPRNVFPLKSIHEIHKQPLSTTKLYYFTGSFYCTEDFHLVLSTCFILVKPHASFISQTFLDYVIIA